MLLIMKTLFSKRFTDLLAESEKVLATKYRAADSYISSWYYVDDNLFLGWKVKAKNLLERACGLESQHFKHFEEEEKRAWSGSFDLAKNLRAVLLAAEEDYNGGHLNSIRTMVQEEVFDSELEQASELLQNGYKVPAAVVAGIVLEVTLKELCGKHGLASGKLDRMNADLCKANAYTLLTQKRITAIAQIRNDAAHGNSDGFNDSDVKSMIDDVRRFVTDHI